jgi:hypothetical protein
MHISGIVAVSFIGGGNRNTRSSNQWFHPGTPVSSANKTDRHCITETLLKVALNIITLTQQDTKKTTYEVVVVCLSLIVFFHFR